MSSQVRMLDDVFWLKARRQLLADRSHRAVAVVAGDIEFALRQFGRRTRGLRSELRRRRYFVSKSEARRGERRRAAKLRSSLAHKQARWRERRRLIAVWRQRHGVGGWLLDAFVAAPRIPRSLAERKSLRMPEPHGEPA